MQDHEDGISEIVAIMLLVALGMILSAMVFSGILSFAGNMEQTAYVAVDADESPPGMGIRITSMAGDTVVFGGGVDEIPLEIIVEDSEGAHPLDQPGPRIVFSPGSSICIWLEEGGYRVGETFPPTGAFEELRLPLSIRLIDGRHHTQIARVFDALPSSASSGTALPTSVPTAEPTTAVTTVITTTTTTTPTIQADFDVPYVVMKKEVTFEGRVIAGEPVTWTWTFTDTGGKSESRNGETVHYTFANSGSGWTITLTVTDAGGRSGTVTKPVDVHNK